MLGRWKSGRKWKEAAQRSTAKIVSRGDASLNSWGRKLKQRQERQMERLKFSELESQKQIRAQELSEKRKKRKERKILNEQKSQIVQKLTNSKKIGKLSRKDRRKLKVVAP